jgi:hypothetical protein
MPKVYQLTVDGEVFKRDLAVQGANIDPIAAAFSSAIDLASSPFVLWCWKVAARTTQSPGSGEEMAELFNAITTR